MIILHVPNKTCHVQFCFIYLAIFCHAETMIFHSNRILSLTKVILLATVLNPLRRYFNMLTLEEWLLLMFESHLPLLLMLFQVLEWPSPVRAGMGALEGPSINSIAMDPDLHYLVALTDKNMAVVWKRESQWVQRNVQLLAVFLIIALHFWTQFELRSWFCEESS